MIKQVNRDESCPCGSGNKYKKSCLSKDIKDVIITGLLGIRGMRKKFSSAIGQRGKVLALAFGLLLSPAFPIAVQAATDNDSIDDALISKNARQEQIKEWIEILASHEISIYKKAMENLADNQPASIEFLIKALGHKNIKIRIRAGRVLREKIGILAIPYLEKAIPESPRHQGNIESAIRDISKVKKTAESPRRKANIVSATQAAGKIKKPDVQPVVEVQISEAERKEIERLIQELNGGSLDMRNNIVKALGAIGPAAVPALTEALKHENLFVRGPAAYALGEIGPTAKAAVPSLIEVLQDEGRGVRYAAVYALGKIDSAANAAIPALIAALQDSYWLVRKKTSEVLGEIGPGAEKAIPGLTELLNDENQDVKKSAKKALGKIRKSPKSSSRQGKKHQ